MKNSLMIIAVFLFSFAHTVFAKEIAVLLPVAGPLTAYEKTELTKEIVESLSGRYELKHGEEVDRIVKQVFQEESKKKDCDETNCYRRIAAQYHAEKIVAIRVTQTKKGNFLVTYNLYNVPADEMSVSQKMECAGCSFEKLKVICKELIDQVSKR